MRVMNLKTRQKGNSSPRIILALKFCTEVHMYRNKCKVIHSSVKEDPYGE